MKRFLPAALGVVLIAGAAGLGFVPAAEIPAPDAGAGQGRIDRLCPSFQQTGLTQRVGVAGASVSKAPVAQRDQGTAVTAPGVAAAPARPERWSAEASSPFAATLGATAAGGPERGLSLLDCPVPRSDQWFVGVRSHQGATSTLELTNLDNTDAEVNVSLYATSGVVAAPGARGIVVPANSTRAVPLSPLASSADPLGVHVQTVTGRVAADLRVKQWAQSNPVGADWVGSAAAPSEKVVVAGIPDGQRLLVVTNPGDRTADVDLELLGTSGPFRAADAESVAVPAGSTRVVKLGAGAGPAVMAVRLSSNVPIVAAAEVTTPGGEKAQDWAVVPGGTLMGANAVAQLPVPAQATTLLALTNPGSEPARAHVKASLKGAEKLSRDVEVPAGATVTLDAVMGADPLVEVASEAEVYAAAIVTAPAGSVKGLAVLALVDSSAAGAAVPIERDARVGA